MKINCQYPTIIRNPEFNSLILQGYTELYNNNNLITKLTSKQIRIALSDNYISIPEIQINQGYQLINPEENKHLPEKITEIYKYTKINGISKKEYTEQFYKYIKPNRSEYKRTYTIPYNEIDNYIMLNPETGTYQQIFTTVPCCHCVLCHQAKRNRLSSRVQLESLNHLDAPLFITLTYANEHYPTNFQDVAFHTKEIQNFNKRLRKSLEKYNIKYKYFFVSEYGSKYGRLHYHAILFGLNTPELMKLTTNNFSKYDNKFLPELYTINKLIYNAWNKGIIDVQEAVDNSGKYISKYVGKSQKGQNTKSLKSINLGNHFLTPSKIEEIRQNTSENSFLVAIDNTIQEIPLYSWISNKIYPSIARQLSIEFRSLIKSIYYDIKFLKLTNTIEDTIFQKTIINPFLKDYSKFIKLLNLEDVIPNITKTPNNNETFQIITRNINNLKLYNYDIDEVIRINTLREEHIMLSNVTTYDVDYNAYIETIQVKTRKNSERDMQ